MSKVYELIAYINGTSKSEARRQIVAGAVRINGVKYTKPDEPWTYHDEQGRLRELAVPK